MDGVMLVGFGPEDDGGGDQSCGPIDGSGYDPGAAPAEGVDIGHIAGTKRLNMAFAFVALCDQHMGIRGFGSHNPYGGGAATEIREQDLHPAQEAAFRRACALLGEYFDGKLDERANRISVPETEESRPAEAVRGTDEAGGAAKGVLRDPEADQDGDW